MEDEQLLNLELSVSEINVILKTLSKHPFEEVAQLINKIKTQGESQITIPPPVDDV